MDILEKLNCAIDYVEQHITDERNLSKIAQLACCSTYDFQRMFSFITDISIDEYIRRRRLTLAAFELQQSNIEWLPTSEYEKVEGPQFEMYGGTSECGYIELWLPVAKK